MPESCVYVYVYVMLLQQVPAGAQLSAYSSLLQHARHFIKQRRRDIQARQQAVMAAQADWRAVLSAMEEQQRLQLQQQQQQDDAGGGGAVGSELSQAVQQLRQLKGVLQEQIRGLNEETQQVKSLKARVSRGSCCSWCWAVGGPVLLLLLYHMSMVHERSSECMGTWCSAVQGIVWRLLLVRGCA